MNNEDFIKFDYTGWPAGLLERTITVTVEAWHSTYTAVKATKIVEMKEVDCSVWSKGQTGPIDLGAVALNSVQTSWELVIPFHATTPDACKNSVF